MPLVWMALRKPRWLRLMQSLNCSLNSTQGMRTGRVKRKEGGVRLWSHVLAAWGWGASRLRSASAQLTGGVCVLNHTGLVFLSFFLQPNRRQGSLGAGASPGPLPTHSQPDEA